MAISLKIPEMIRHRKSKKDRHYNGHQFEDTKEMIRHRKSKDRHYNGQKKKRTKGKTMIYNTLRRGLQIGQHESNNRG